MNIFHVLNIFINYRWLGNDEIIIGDLYDFLEIAFNETLRGDYK